MLRNYKMYDFGKQKQIDNAQIAFIKYKASSILILIVALYLQHL